MAQSVEPPISAQVMISQFVSSSPVSGSVLKAQSLEPASDSVSLSFCPFPTHALSLSVSQKMNKRLKILKKKNLNVNSTWTVDMMRSPGESTGRKTVEGT